MQIKMKDLSVISSDTFSCLRKRSWDVCPYWSCTLGPVNKAGAKLSFSTVMVLRLMVIELSETRIAIEIDWVACGLDLHPTLQLPELEFDSELAHVPIISRTDVSFSTTSSKVRPGQSLNVRYLGNIVRRASCATA